MTDFVSHGLRIEPTRDELSRQHFVSGMRRYILHDLAGSMRLNYPSNVKVVQVPCTGRVDIIHLLRAIEGGADAVYVAG